MLIRAPGAAFVAGVSSSWMMNGSTFVEMPVTPKRGGQIFGFDSCGIVRPRHHHDELEFNLGTQGVARFAVGSRSIYVYPGTLLWFLPGQDHLLEAASPDFQMWIAAFKPWFVEAQQRAAGPGALPTVADQVREVDSDACHELSDMCRTAFAGPYEAERDELLLRLLSLALSAGRTSQSQRASVHVAIQKSLRHLILDPSLGREELARRAGLGPEALSRKFSHELGISLPEYRNRLRLGRFLRALDEGQTNLLGAALDAGFGSYSQCHRILREQTGDSPSAFASLEVRRAAMRRSIPLGERIRLI
ncbi:MAG: AraC family transcriptional regulator [Myxococcales bacterium]|nr:MAG: AraC family transcriptional regulator [Myxococcales bacterium]